jgi:hypothetical protein
MLYGAKIPKGVDVWGEKEDGVLARWTCVDGYNSVCWPQDSDIVGAWVAVDCAGIVELDLSAGATALATVLACKQFKAAKKRWEKFAAFAAKQGVTFDKPELWFALTEVA